MLLSLLVLWVCVCVCVALLTVLDVVESVDVNSGYRVIYTNQNGTIGKGINSVLVVNHRDPKSKIPKTGYGTLTGDIVGAGTSALAFALGAVLRGRSKKVVTRKKKTDEDND